jgi:vacuolar-type H+-ATPase subunit D/Vma8
LYSDVDELEKFFDILKQKQEVTKEEFIELTNKVSKINKSLKPYD